MATNAVGGRGADPKMTQADMKAAVRTQMDPKTAIRKDAMSKMVAKLSKGKEE